jgi:hypothetical protein
MRDSVGNRIYVGDVVVVNRCLAVIARVMPATIEVVDISDYGATHIYPCKRHNPIKYDLSFIGDEDIRKKYVDLRAEIIDKYKLTPEQHDR